MSTVAVFSLLIGSLIGGRFRIFILPPTIVLGAAIIGAVSAWQGEGPAHTVVTILVFAMVLQLGYLCGAILASAQRRIASRPYRRSTVPSSADRG